MIVVADTSPINYLAQIHLLHLLPELYGQIIITPSVLEELSHRNAPSPVKHLLEECPEWLLVRGPSSSPPDFSSTLGAGEREAIQYAEECHAALLLIDERRGWSIAESRGLVTIGTLGVLLQAGRRGLIDPVEAYVRLTSMTNFRLSVYQRADFFQKAAPSGS